MRYGVTVFLTDESIRPDELARAVEERGLDSVWVPEHTHIPVRRATPAPSGDPVLPREYARTLDPWVSLTAMAAVTERVRIGTGIHLVAQHDPIASAKAVASIDHLSGGRVSLGVGFGWNREEIEGHGVDFATRRELVEDRLAMMRSLWADDEAAHTGTHVSLEPSWAWPKPVQTGADGRTGVPVLLGGGLGPRLREHLVRWADGWIPVGGGGLSTALPQLRDELEAAGRDPAAFEVVPFGTLPDDGKLDHYESLGITETVFRLPSAGRDEVLPVLDEQAALVARRR